MPSGQLKRRDSLCCSASRKEKFTALFHHLSLGLLEQALFELKDNAAPGVDGVTRSDYEADLERK